MSLEEVAKRPLLTDQRSFVLLLHRSALSGDSLNWKYMAQPLVGMDLADLRDALGPSQPGYRAKQVYDALYRGQASNLVQITTLPATLRENLAAAHAIGLPEVAHLYQSADGTRRYLLRLEDGRTVET